jgi:enamine deaminase RidA (YjgF/YER057c/UK114 family)
VDSDEESLLFVEGIAASDFAESVSSQSEEVFARLDGVLSANGFEVDDIVRQWNYIGNIVACRDGKQNYQEFNDARTIYYNKGVWSNGYPAATGIGASFEGVVVGCIAFKNNHRKAVYPIDNPLQVAAHIYSKDVLIDNAANAVKSTPKFERAKLIETAQGACCFVSGTAAIRGEESVDAHSARLQTIKTIENIEYLVSKENLERFGCKPYELKCVQLQVFIKHKEDYEVVREEVKKAYPHLSVLYSLADVCRSELLVEIEGILIS